MKILLSIFGIIFGTSTLAFSAITSDGSYKLDEAHAHVGFEVTHLGVSKTVGRFNDLDGDFLFQANGESSVIFVIQMESVDTNNDRRDRHLRSDDFFDVDSFETMTFKSTAFTYNAAGDPETITGDLDLHGVKKSVMFAVEAVGAGKGPLGRQRAGYTAKTSLKRSEFEMTRFSKIVSDDVQVTVNLEIIKK